MPSVLIVDDLLSIHEMLDAVIQPTGFTTAFATDGEKALARYKTTKFDLVLADIDMKPMDGITMLRQLKTYDPEAVVIIMTAYASTDSAVQALKYGAFDYLQKPFRVDELISTLKRGIEYKNFNAEREGGGGEGSGGGADLESRIVGTGARTRKLVQQLRKLASVRTPVLIHGEPGTGKTFVAEVLHGAANPPEAPLVRIDCALSSEANFREGLLGRNGAGGEWIQKAKGGTLLLQRIHCLSPQLQKELVGVLRNTAHGFRLFCTTTEDLERLTDEGRFNDELFYRVAALPVAVPSLRERIEDLPALVRLFAGNAANPTVDPSQIELSEDALKALESYHWPGNLAELNQVITKVASAAETRVVTAQQLPLRVKDVRKWPTLAEFLAGQERQYIDIVVHACKGDRSAAAAILGVDSARLH